MLMVPALRTTNSAAEHGRDGMLTLFHLQEPFSRAMGMLGNIIEKALMTALEMG
ncbi:MAG: hypothetical protein VKL58_00820 [Cyanobacteriota bacterium]|nr:hypothetical protein [Cyanobacteriota bacterium]